MSAHELIIALMPWSMGVAVVAAAAIGWLAARITTRVYRERIRRLTRSARSLTDQIGDVEQQLREERSLVDALVEDLTDTRLALRSAIGDPLKASPRHVSMTRVRAVAARPLPGESTGAHAAITEENDRG